jgi:3',5'-cyclic AMP phosphodiesterase CpdA
VPLSIAHPEIFGVTETSVTVLFSVEDGAGPVDAPARVLLDGEVRAACEGPAGTRQIRIEGLEPGTAHEIAVECEDARAEPDDWFPGRFETLPAPAAREVASFATLNDLHFGEPRFGGTLLPNGDYGDERPGFPAIHEGDTEVPYWRFMNEDAITEINEAGVDATVVKGDIADRGRPEQFAWAREAFARLEAPHHAFLGNHDHYGLEEGIEVDGYALLGQPPAPRTVDLGGWRLLLLETALPGAHHGVFGEDRMAWLGERLAETRESATPTLLFMHHHPVPPERRHQYPNTIGIEPDHSVRLFELVGRHPQVRGVLIGHTHRNRVRHHPASGATPWVEVHCTKDHPGGWAHYRLFDDGSFRQEVRRTGSRRALDHSSRCRDFFDGMYRPFSLGRLEQRSFATPAFR